MQLSLFRFGIPVVIGTEAVVVEGEVGVLVRLTFVDEDKASLLVSHDVGRLAQALQQMVMDILAVAVYHLYIVHLVGDGTIIYVLARGPTEHDAVCAYIVLGRGRAEAAGKLASLALGPVLYRLVACRERHSKHYDNQYSLHDTIYNI